MTKQLTTISLFFLLLLSGCKIPSPSDKNIKKDYFTGGGLRSELIMTNGNSQNGILKRYGFNEKLASVSTIKNGVRNGEEVGYDEQGRVLWRYFFVNGKQEGLQKAFYPNGDLMLSYTYKQGIRNGEAKTYQRDGAIIKKVMFKNGKIFR